jgi:hypothetical protein
MGKQRVPAGKPPAPGLAGTTLQGERKVGRMSSRDSRFGMTLNTG